MRIHHLNCGTLCPYGGHFMDGETPGVGHAKLVCHCLLIETNEGLVLVDTGIGEGDIRAPRRLSGFFRSVLQPQFEPEETAARQILRLGFQPADVRHIVVTHLDFDHAGGLEDFPRAAIHVHAFEFNAAVDPHGAIGKRRYCSTQWDSLTNWEFYSEEGESWFGFRSVRELHGLSPDILIIPLFGHTHGHCGVAVNEGSHWLLHAGDAYFHHQEIDWRHPDCPPGLRLYQRLMEVDRGRRLQNQERLRQLVRHYKDDVTVFSAHDAKELSRLQQRATAEKTARQYPLTG